MHDFLGVVAARARQHRHLAGRFFDHELDDAPAFGVRQRGRLAGRAARHEKVNAGVDLPPREALDAGLVDRAGARKRSDERRARRQ